jgi:hypothetical protein
MHPLIYKFWENNGYSLTFRKSGYWVGIKQRQEIEVAYRSFLNISKNNYPDYYIWENEEVSEEHMLKIIKMKAFL